VKQELDAFRNLKASIGHKAEQPEPRQEQTSRKRKSA
jgi:hypothetical protein